MSYPKVTPPSANLRPVHGFGLHVMKNPAGTWSFVGTIPVDLSLDEKATPEDLMAGRYWIPPTLNRLTGSHRTTRTPSFTTREDAVAHAARFGYAVAPEPSNPETLPALAAIPPTPGVTSVERREIPCSCGEDYGDEESPGPCSTWTESGTTSELTSAPLCVCGHEKECHAPDEDTSAPVPPPASCPDCGGRLYPQGLDGVPGCPDCDDTIKAPCSTCDGAGVVGCSPGCPVGDLREDAGTAPLCPECHGFGRPCQACQGVRS